MCDLCRKLEQLEGKRPLSSQEMDTYSAIWQNALSLKIVTHHFKEELIALDADDFYPELEECLEEFIRMIDAVEKHAFLSAKQAALDL